MEPSRTPKVRPVGACEVCHEKKVRCDLAAGQPCSKCRIENSICRPHQRQRKRKRSAPTSRGLDTNGDLHNPGSAPETDGSKQRQAHFPFPSDPQGLTGVSTAALSPSGCTRVVREPDARSPDQEVSPSSQGYLGRSEYFGLDAPRPDGAADKCQFEGENELSRQDTAMLELYGAFELPSVAVQRSLIDSFFTYCAPWMPIVEPRLLRANGPRRASALLLQSVFLAGSRVATAGQVLASSETFYCRAKALFFSSYESNPITKIIAACLLNWWNPSGPEEISIDGSSFWLRVAVSLAYQIGLHREPRDNRNASFRRRLWWTLVARDCQISAAHGRPRAINLADSDALLVSACDFPDGDANADLFPAYVKISMLLGDCTQSYLRHHLTPTKRQDLRNALYCWVNELPNQLRLCSPASDGDQNTYDMRIHCLHVVYFVTLTILYRHQPGQVDSATINAVASFFLASIFEDFLARDEFRFMPPTYKFYLFAVGMAQVQTQSLLSPRSETLEKEFDIVKGSLEALAVRWPSARKSIQVLQNLSTSASAPGQFSTLPPLPTHHEAYGLFKPFARNTCRMWHLVEPEYTRPPNTETRHVPSPRIDTEDSPRRTNRAHPNIPRPFSNTIVQAENNLAATTVTQIPIIGTPDTECCPEEPSPLWLWLMAESSGNWLTEELPGFWPTESG